MRTYSFWVLDCPSSLNAEPCVFTVKSLPISSNAFPIDSAFLRELGARLSSSCKLITHIKVCITQCKLHLTSSYSFMIWWNGLTWLVFFFVDVSLRYMQIQGRKKEHSTGGSFSLDSSGRVHTPYHAIESSNIIYWSTIFFRPMHGNWRFQIPVQQMLARQCGGKYHSDSSLSSSSSD